MSTHSRSLSPGLAASGAIKTWQVGFYKEDTWLEAAAEGTFSLEPHS